MSSVFFPGNSGVLYEPGGSLHSSLIDLVADSYVMLNATTFTPVNKQII